MPECYNIDRKREREDSKMKKNKIRGGVYGGAWWADFTKRTDAKHMAHKQERARAKKLIKNF